METIVVYSSGKKPLNAYPRYIAASHPQGCCSTHMIQVGKIKKDERGFPFHYCRCQACGFTLRHFLPVVPPDQPPLIQTAPARPPKTARSGMTREGGQ